MKSKTRVGVNFGPWVLFLALISLLAWMSPRSARADVGVGCGDSLACPVCGDGIKGPGEECDDGGKCDGNSGDHKLGDLCDATDSSSCGEANCVQSDDDGCHDDCTLCPRCGNGVTEIRGFDGVQSIEPGLGEENHEDCDDGMQCTDGTDCTMDPTVCFGIGDSTCSTRSGDECQANCELPKCGDGVTDENEECDDGNNSNLDLCATDCNFTICGDGVVQADQGEQCDDGNELPGDGCFNCQECPNLFCGDGLVGDNEECDDGNTDSGDGCDSNCKVEGFCGNGKLDDGEACDFIDPLHPENGLVEGSTGDLGACGFPPSSPGFVPGGKPDPCQSAICGNNSAATNDLMPEECDGTDDEACGEKGKCDDDCTCEDNECPEDEGSKACTPEQEAGHKVTICHIPPGNPDNRHTICIDEHALSAHQTHHGDTFGACEDECSPATGLTVGDGGGDGTTKAAGGCSLIR